MRRAILLLMALTSCASDISPDPRCRRTEDCDESLCIGGRCQSFAGPDMRDDSAANTDAARGSVVDLPPPLCAGAAAATAETIALNEVLANVPAGATGDANGDGLRDAYEDEFVELVNTSARTVDLTGVRISSSGKLKHTFEPLCLGAGDSIVVFGGGSIGPSVMGNAVVAERRLSLPNEGGEVRVTAPDGEVASFEWSRAPAASFTRVPQLTGVNWASHLDVSALPFSPGRCPDGAPLQTRCSAE